MALWYLTCETKRISSVNKNVLGLEKYQNKEKDKNTDILVGSVWKETVLMCSLHK